MGKTFKDRKKFDRKNERNDGLKEQKREPRKGKWVAPEVEEDDGENIGYDPFPTFIDDDEY
jgi:hypothetical protein